MSQNHGLSQYALETLKKIFQKYLGIRKVILYGSRAKGNYKNGSDIDITLETDDTFTHNDLLKIRWDFDDSDMPYTVDVSIYKDLKNENLKDHIKRVGKVLYERG
jgi:predicted nucleotidyltransferase